MTIYICWQYTVDWLRAFFSYQTTVTINPHYKDEIMDSSSSELSDIAEVEEDIASEMSHDDQSKSISQATPPKKQVIVFHWIFIGDLTEWT